MNKQQEQQIPDPDFDEFMEDMEGQDPPCLPNVPVDKQQQG